MQGILSSRSSGDLFYNIIVFLLYLFVITFILKYLWNSVLTKYITILRPVQGDGFKSYVDIFLIAFAIAMFKM